MWGLFWLGLVLSIGRLSAQTGTAPGSISRQTLTNAAQIRALGTNAAASHQPVRVHGVVTYYDPGWSLLFVQDETGGFFVRSSDSKFDFHAGEEIEIDGVTDGGTLNPIVERPSIKRLGAGKMPTPLLVTGRELATGSFDCRWVEAEGVVRIARDYWGRGYLELSSGRDRLKVYVLNFPGKDFNRLSGAKVRLHGVCSVEAADGKIISVHVMAPDISDIVVEEKSPGDPFGRPVISRNGIKSANSDQLLRVEGIITEVISNQCVTIKDLEGEIDLAVADTSGLYPGIWLGAVGFPSVKTNECLLEDVIVRRIGYGAKTFELRERLAGQGKTAADALPVLKTVSRIRELSAEEAAKGYPIRLGGVVTYHDPEWQMIFFQGATEGIFVDTGGAALDVQVGQLAFLEGYSAPGHFAPVIESPVFHFMGSGAMPEARPVTSAQLFSGDNDSQWLELHGVVRGYTSEKNRLTLELAMGKSLFKAVVMHSEDQNVPPELIDAEVRLRGVCGSLFNKNRQFLGVQLYVPDLAFIELEKLPPAADQSPVVPVQDLLRFKSKTGAGHRVRIQGIITMATAQNLFYLEDSTGGARVTVTGGTNWQTGDFVDVLGFPATGGSYSPILEGAMVQKLGSRAIPPAIRFQPGESLEKDLAVTNLDARRVEMEGRLVDRFSRSGEKILVLQSGRTLFNVHLPLKSLSRQSSDWPIGSVLHLTGVSAVHVDEAHNPRSFSLLLASSDDLALISKPSSWTLEKTAGLAAVLVLLVLLSSLSAVSLRRSVRRQTRLIREQQEALQHAYDDLEKRVQDRTAEWVRANERLSQEIEERKKAHEALIHERQLLGSMMDNVPDPIYFKDTASRFLRINRAGLQAFGLTDPSQVAGKTDFDFFDEKHAAPALADELEIMRTGEPLLGKEEKEIYPDGRVKWILTSKMPLRNTAGQIIGTFGISRDITARKYFEELLRKQQEEYRVIFDSVPAMVTYKDTRNRIVRVNKFAADLIGLPVEEIEGKHMSAVDPIHAESSHLDDLEVIETGQPKFGIVETMARSSGETRWLRTDKIPYRDTGGRIIGVIVFAVDITARKQAEEELRQVHADLEKRVSERTAELLQANQRLTSEIQERHLAEESLRQSQERFLKAFRASPLPIDISRFSDGAYLDVNESFLRMLGYAREELIGETALDLNIWVDPAERVSLLKLLLEQRSVRDVELKLRTKTGRIRNVLASAEFIEVGQEPCVLFIVLDITDRLNLETQLRQSQKMQAVGQLAAGVAHDFNNILTVIQGHIGLLLSNGRATPEQIEPLEQAATAATRAAQLTRQLLTFSRKQLMQPAQINLNEVIGNAAKMLGRILGEDIRLRFSYAPGLPAVWADTGMMEQMLLNLAVNSRDAMPRGGELSISTRLIPRKDLHPSKNPPVENTQFICLTVADTGCGMGPAVLERIFEPFFTTKDVGRGTGLGLAMVYGIVEQHQGWIEVASEVEKGSVFQIYLPASNKRETPAKALPPAGTRGGNETILIVEDESAVRMLVKTILTRYGYTVLEAAHSREALEIWEREKDKISLMLTDMVMPEGISGWDLAERLKAQAPGFKVVFTSGYSVDLFDNNREFREGVNFVSKPYQPHLLAKAIRDRLDSGVEVARPLKP